MNNTTKRFLLGMLLSIPIIVATFASVIFRPFWHSGWGQLTLASLLVLAVAFAAGWRGKDKPFSFRSGLIAAIGTVVICIAAFLTQSTYVGIGLFLVLTYIGLKTKLSG